MIFKCERRRNRGDLRESVSLKGRRRSISDNQESARTRKDEESRKEGEFGRHGPLSSSSIYPPTIFA